MGLKEGTRMRSIGDSEGVEGGRWRHSPATTPPNSQTRLHRRPNRDEDVAFPQHFAVHHSDRQKKKRRQQRRPSRAKEVARIAETRSSEALTIGWGVTVTTLVVSNLLTITAHYYHVLHPDAVLMAMLGELLLLAGAALGVISLLLLPFLYRVRRVPPPRGLAVFGACVAAAPIVGLLVTTMR